MVKVPWPEDAVSTEVPGGAATAVCSRSPTLSAGIVGACQTIPPFVVAAVLYALDRVGDEAVEERPA